MVDAEWFLCDSRDSILLTTDIGCECAPSAGGTHGKVHRLNNLNSPPVRGGTNVRVGGGRRKRVKGQENANRNAAKCHAEGSKTCVKRWGRCQE